MLMQRLIFCSSVCSRKREFAAEAGSALSFWARPTHRSSVAFDRTAESTLPMPLPEPPIEFAGTMSCSTAAAMPCSSMTDVSDLLDSVAFHDHEWRNGHYFSLFHRIRVCVVKQQLGLP